MLLKGRRRYVAQMCWCRLWGWTDLAALKTLCPDVVQLSRVWRECVHDLKPLHAEYVTTISSDAMALSLKTAAFLMAWCLGVRPRRVLDTGSGFSSYVLRRYAALAGGPVEIWSTDDDAKWIHTTQQYLLRHGVIRGHLLLWDEFVHLDEGGFDLILHDLGSKAGRLETLENVVAKLAPKGVVVCDDWHRAEYRRPATERLRNMGLRLISLKRYTLDNFLRYAALAYRPAKGRAVPAIAVCATRRADHSREGAHLPGALR